MTKKEVLNKIDDLPEESISSLLMALDLLKIEGLSNATELPARIGRKIELIDKAGHKYYATLDEDGFVATIRIDSQQGKVIYAPYD